MNKARDDGTVPGGPVAEPAKKIMTADDFFAEAERTGLTLESLMPSVNARLREMEEEGVIVKHADGGHAWASDQGQLRATPVPPRSRDAAPAALDSDAEYRAELEKNGQQRLVE